MPTPVDHVALAAGPFEPADPQHAPRLPFVVTRRTSRDGNLQVLDCRVPAGERHIPPLQSHAIAFMMERRIDVESWSPSHVRRLDTLVQGDAQLVPAGQSISFCSDQARLIILLVRPNVLSDFSGPASAGPAIRTLRASAAVRDPLLRCIAIELAGECDGSDDPVSPFLGMVGSAVGAHLLSHYVDSVELPRGALDRRHMSLITDHVRSHLHTSIRLEELASITGYSVCHFSHLFKATTGLSPMRFVLDCKMRRARELIETSRMTLTQVGLGLGYSDSAHFSRTFKAYWNLMPSAVQRPLPGCERLERWSGA